MSNTYALGDAFRYEAYEPGPPSNPPQTPATRYEVRFVPSSASPPTPTFSQPTRPAELSGGRPGVSREQRFAEALEILRQGRFSVIDLFLYVLNASNHNYIRGLLGDKIFELLDGIMETDDGKLRMEMWMRGRGVDLIATVIEREMDSLREKLRLPASAMTPSYVDGWSFKSAIGDLTREDAPVLTGILMRAGQDKKARAKNKKKTPEMVCLRNIIQFYTDYLQICQIIISQLAYSRSFHTCGFQAFFSFFLWTPGCQRQTIDALYRCGLSPSFD